MSGIWKWFLDSGLVQAQVMKGIRWAGTAAGAAVVTLAVNFLSKHGFQIDANNADLQSAGLAISGFVIAGLSFLWSLRDAKHVAVAIQASAESGEPVPTSLAKALARGDQVKLPSGALLTLGKSSPAGQTPEQEAAETAALNKTEVKP